MHQFSDASLTILTEHIITTVLLKLEIYQIAPEAVLILVHNVTIVSFKSNAMYVGENIQ